MKEGRIACEVPGCGRTFKAEGYPGERVLCGQHYRLIPSWMRRRTTKLRRLVKKISDPTAMNRCLDLEARWWNTCRARAIEIAMGISA